MLKTLKYHGFMNPYYSLVFFVFRYLSFSSC